jgi:hypothetical protein
MRYKSELTTILISQGVAPMLWWVPFLLRYSLKKYPATAMESNPAAAVPISNHQIRK